MDVAIIAWNAEYPARENAKKATFVPCRVFSLALRKRACVDVDKEKQTAVHGHCKSGENSDTGLKKIQRR